MIKKMVLGLLILFILMISISSASAEDNLSTFNNEILNIEEETGTFEDLTAELDAVEDGGTYNLTKNYKYDSGSKDGIKINKTITINGENHRIDGNAQSRIFTTFEGNITLNNLVLINGFADKGGAIYAHNSIIFNNVTFINNHAKNGGAVYMYADLVSEDTLPTNFTYCTFDGNYAENGAAIYLEKPIILPPVPYEPLPDEDEETTPYDDETLAYEGDEPTPDDYEEPIPDDDGEDGDDEVIDLPNDLLISNTIFKNSHGFSKGLIYIQSAITISICDSTFANSTSEYGTAVYSDVGCNLKCNNDLFMNLNSKFSGGAFSGFSIFILTVDNSTFINVSAQNNGGTILYDINGWGFESEIPGTVIVNNSRFIDSKARFGGSIVQFGGDLNIINSSFENNQAFSGGAVYVGATKLTVENSTFKNNEINDEGNGGAINEFSGKLTIKNSRFMDNAKNAVYCCENQYSITDSYFNNNNEAIHSLYVKSCFTNNNTYTNDLLAENTTDEDYYILVINTTGTKLNLIENDMDIMNVPARFDSRDWGWITPVKDQTVTGACWVFSTCASLEAALLKSTGIEYSLSVNNIQKNLIMYSKYGHIESAESGFISMASKFILSWYGALTEDYDPFDINGKITRPIITSDAIHIQDLLCLPAHQNATDNDAIKRAIMKYGAMSTSICIDYKKPYFNNETSSLYCNDPEKKSNHAICVVGWDDNYPADKFIYTPPGNGAWIVKNSYGTSLYDEGYIYVSYYDMIIFTETDNIAFILENTEDYNKNYQTDIGGEIALLTDRGSYTYKNTYKAIEDDFISAVGTYFDSNEEYCLEIYVNGNLKHTQTGISPFRGYHTVDLTKNIPIRKGDKFMAVAFKSSLPFVNSTFQHFPESVSLVDWGEGWVDLSALNATATLKVYTKPMVNLTPTITVSDVNTVYNGGKYLTVTVKDIFGENIAGIKVTVKLSNGVVKTLMTDSKGQAKFLMNNLAPNTYTATITTEAFGKYVEATATAKVVVKKATPKSDGNEKTVKKSVKTKKYTIPLKSKHAKLTKITLKLKCKVYKASTNGKVSNKAKIIVKPVWKTVSKGSKLKITVMQIQRALKNNGYYLTYAGHYLKVDGIYQKYTVMAVKQFQKANGLNVTGKVDEETARKLKLI